jgi:hypothetical protein
MSFNVIKAPVVIATGKGLSRSKIVKGDTALIQMRVGGDTTGATVKFSGRLRDDIFKTVVIQKVSTTPAQILVEPTGLTLFSDITIQIASADTSVLDPNTVIEYDIQISDDVSYGGTAGVGVTISPATFTLYAGYFTVIDQVTI